MKFFYLNPSKGESKAGRSGDYILVSQRVCQQVSSTHLTRASHQQSFSGRGPPAGKGSGSDGMRCWTREVKGTWDTEGGKEEKEVRGLLGYWVID